MKHSSVKFSLTIMLFTLAVSACTSKKPVTDDLPKDISERPASEASQKYDAAQLDKLRSAIEGMITKEKCNDANEWSFTGLGAKACGGPITYIAFPKKSQREILLKIADYNNKMSEFNAKYNIMSDCMLVAEPVEVRCKNGKAELIY